MSRLPGLSLNLGALCALLVVLFVAGCASAELTPAQREGVDLRRYCEQHLNDTAKCVGYHGFI
jgi:hypothetical protein